MNAYTQDLALCHRIQRALGVEITADQARVLRRAERTLHRWGERECGDSNGWASWAIERDEKTGEPFLCLYPHDPARDGKATRRRIPDLECGALRRVEKVCREAGLHFFHQSDPRGCALYVAREMLTASDYTKGVACCEASR